MATNTFLDSATVTALLDSAGGSSGGSGSTGQTVATSPPDSPEAGAVWWDTSVVPHARRVYIAGAWEDSGARFDPTSGQLTLVQAGKGLSFTGSDIQLDIGTLPLAP